MALTASGPSTIDHLKPFFDVLAAVANAATLVATILAIYLFLANRHKLSAALQLLLNFAFLSSLGELKEKLERLNEYNCGDQEDILEIRNIFNEIAGQIKGNRRLSGPLAQITLKIETFASAKRLFEPSKRALTSELREQLRHIQVDAIEQSERP